MLIWPIFEAITAGVGCVSISSYPGSGKTWSIIKAVSYLPRRIKVAYASYSEALARAKTSVMADVIPLGIEGILPPKCFDLLIIDDPIKNMNDACDPYIREATFRWILQAQTQLNANGRIVMVQTRSHSDDPMGRVKNRKEWHCINISAPFGELELLKGKLSAVEWDTMYFGNPEANLIEQ